MKINKSIDDTKFHLAKIVSFLAQYIFGVVWEEDHSIPTACTDGKKCRVNPDFWLRLTRRQRITLVAHEAAHIFLLHHLRRGNRDCDLYNKAADYVINLMLVRLGLEPIPGWLYDEQFDGMSTEQVYNLLNDPDSGTNPNAGDQIGDVEDQKNDDGSDMTPAEKEEEVREAQTASSVASKVLEKAGLLPEPMVEALGGVLYEPDDYTALLQRFVSEVTRGRLDYNMMRPLPTYAKNNIFRPLLDSPGLAKFAVGVDISGSMDIEEPIRELHSILAAYDQEGVSQSLTLIFCNTQVQGEQELEFGDEIVGSSGGGTRFSPVMDYVVNHEDYEVFSALIYITDGRCKDFGKNPGLPVVWLLTPNRTNHFSPPFGEVMEMN